jgi:hypothetical protein
LIYFIHDLERSRPALCDGEKIMTVFEVSRLRNRHYVDESREELGTSGESQFNRKLIHIIDSENPDPPVL